MLTITNQSALHHVEIKILFTVARPVFLHPSPPLLVSSSSPSPLLLETTAVILPSVVPVPPPIPAAVPPPVPAPISAVSPPIPVSAPVSPLRSLLLYLVLQVSQTTAGWVRA